MMFAEPLEAVVKREPWRQRVGYPDKVDDPMWAPQEFCTGDVEYETTKEGSKHWVCMHCGYIGWSTSTQHYPLLSPAQFLANAQRAYLESRVRKGCSLAQAEQQIATIMAVAVKAALAQPETKDLRSFLEKLTNL